MFYGGFNQERVVEVPDASPDGFRVMLRYVYTDEAEFTDDHLESVVQVSDKYLLVGLFAECVEWVKRNVTAANVCRFLPLGELYSDIAEICCELLISHGNDALNSEAFLSLPRNLLAKLLASDHLVADELTVYGRMMDWAKRQLERNGHQDDPATVRSTLGNLLYLIRFPLLAAEEFANGPAESGILSAEAFSSFLNVLTREFRNVSPSSSFTVKKKPALFSVDARSASSSIVGVMQQLGLRRQGRCEHETRINADVVLLQKMKLRETAPVSPLSLGNPRVCLTCSEVVNHTMLTYLHGQETQHFLHYSPRSDTISCGKCFKKIASV